MKNKMIAAISLAVLAVAMIAAVVVVNPFASSPPAGGEESMHSEGMAALGTAGGEESAHPEGMAALGTSGGEESAHPEGMAPLTVNVEAETRILKPGMDAGASASARPYIGAAISEIESGAALVVEVLDDGPSQGVLKAGDLITAVEGEAIGGARDLVDAISEAGAGASLSLTIERDDRAADVSVSVGEMSEDAASQVRRYSYSRTFDLPADDFSTRLDMLDKFVDMDDFDFPTKMDVDMDAFDKFVDMDDFGFSMKADADMFDKFADVDAFGFSMMNLLGESGGVARMEKSVEVADGEFETHRAAMGTVIAVDADAGTFTLQPIDGSAAITYAVTDDTKTFISGAGGIGGLAADGETPTLAIDVDGVAEMVGQGEGAVGAFGE